MVNHALAMVQPMGLQPPLQPFGLGHVDVAAEAIRRLGTGQEAKATTVVVRLHHTWAEQSWEAENLRLAKLAKLGFVRFMSWIFGVFRLKPCVYIYNISRYIKISICSCV